MDMLLLADAKGIVDITPEAIARMTNVPLEIVTNAIMKLMEPDSASRSSDHDGRRLIALDPPRTWGWIITNYEKYRGMQDAESRREYFREYKRKRRQPAQNSRLSTVSTVDKCGMSTMSNTSTKAEAEAEADKNLCATDVARGHVLPTEEPTPEGVALTPAAKTSKEMTPEQEQWFTSWWAEYWRRRSKKDAREAFRKQVKTEARFQQVMAATLAQKPEMLSRPEDKRPHGATWLNGERWEDEITSPAATTAPGIYPEYREVD